MDQPTRINDEMQILWQNGEFVFASRANRKKTYRRWAILCSSFNSDSSNKNAVLFPCVIFLMFPFCGRCSCRDFTRNFVFTFFQLLYSSLLSSTIAVARTVRDANSLLDLHFIIQQNNEQTKKKWQWILTPLKRPLEIDTVISTFCGCPNTRTMPWWLMTVGRLYICNRILRTGRFCSRNVLTAFHCHFWRD